MHNRRPHAAADIKEAALFVLVMWFAMVFWHISLYRAVEVYGTSCLEELAAPSFISAQKMEAVASSKLSVLSARLHGITSQIAVLRRNMTLLFSSFLRMYYWILQRSFIRTFSLGTRLRHTPEDSELDTLYLGTSHHIHINFPSHLTTKKLRQKRDCGGKAAHSVNLCCQWSAQHSSHFASQNSL